LKLLSKRKEEYTHTSHTMAHHMERFLEHEAPAAKHQHGHRRLVEWNLGSLNTCRHRCNYMPNEKWNPHMSVEDAEEAGVNALKAIYSFSSQSTLAYERDYSTKRRRARGHARTSKMNERELIPGEE